MHDAELPLGVDALLIAYYQSQRIATSSMYILQSTAFIEVLHSTEFAYKGLVMQAHCKLKPG